MKIFATQFKWNHYAAILLGLLTMAFIIIGIVGGSGVLIFAGLAIGIGGVPSFWRTNKPKGSEKDEAQ